MKTDNDIIIASDLYHMRYTIKVNWFETFDVLKDYLIKNGHTVEYKEDTLFYDGIDFRNIKPITKTKSTKEVKHE